MLFYLAVIALNILVYSGVCRGLWGADLNFKFALGLAGLDVILFLMLLRRAGMFLLKMAFGAVLLLVLAGLFFLLR